MASAEAWGAALPMAPTWVLASVAAWPLPCCCGGAGCWRGGRRRSSSGRRRRCTSSHRSKDIDPTPTIDVVWRARGSALSRIDVDSRVIQGIAARRKLVSQAGNSRPQQGHCARDVRSSHGCAAEIRV